MPLWRLVGARGSCHHGLPIYQDMRQMHGDLGEDANLKAFFRESLVRRDEYEIKEGAGE